MYFLAYIQISMLSYLEVLQLVMEFWKEKSLFVINIHVKSVMHCFDYWWDFNKRALKTFLVSLHLSLFFSLSLSDKKIDCLLWSLYPKVSHNYI